MILELEERGDVRIVWWRDGENRYRDDSLDEWFAVLDQLARVDGPLAVVVANDGKYWSNGLDLDWMSATGAGADFVGRVHLLLGRMLVFPAYTVAAVSGHAFAGGAMLAAACDARVMRADRGWWCLPEADLALPLTDAMYATVASRLSGPTLQEAVVTGRRYTGPEAVAAGIVQDAVAEDSVVDRAVELAAAMARKDRPTLTTHKRLLHGAAAAVCGVQFDGR
jgi:enoyl-CoA hydratase/carnithine racemase